MTIHAVYAGLLSSTARMGVPLADSGAKIKVGDACPHWACVRHRCVVQTCVGGNHVAPNR